MGLFDKLFGKKEPSPVVKTEEKPKDDVIKYSCLVAWWPQYPGVPALIEKIKAENKPYRGMTPAQIKKYLMTSTSSLHQYDKMRFTGLKFEDEPDNKYSPEAFKISLDDVGLLGYVPHKNKARVKGILQKHPDAYIYLEIKCGTAKDIADDGDELALVTTKGEWRANVHFEYARQ